MFESVYVTLVELIDSRWLGLLAARDRSGDGGLVVTLA